MWGIENPDELLTYDYRTYAAMLERLADEAEERQRRSSS